MNFIETLKSVGGVKPCPNREKTEGVLYEGPADFSCSCSECHGTGQILDLAPLLAKPRLLSDVVISLLISKPIDGIPDRNLTDLLVSKSLVGVPDKMEFCGDRALYIICPARCATLGYEVARQLGGTAVVAVPHYQSQQDTFIYDTFSFPIPLDATVLFVTDRVDDSGEMLKVIETVDPKTTVLPYVLCLVAEDVTGLHNRDQVLKVISLHQEI
jgi:hypothetical protein